MDTCMGVVSMNPSKEEEEAYMASALTQIASKTGDSEAYLLKHLEDTVQEYAGDQNRLQESLENLIKLQLKKRFETLEERPIVEYRAGDLIILADFNEVLSEIQQNVKEYFK